MKSIINFLMIAAALSSVGCIPTPVLPGGPTTQNGKAYVPVNKTISILRIRDTIFSQYDTSTIDLPYVKPFLMKAAFEIAFYQGFSSIVLSLPAGGNFILDSGSVYIARRYNYGFSDNSSNWHQNYTGTPYYDTTVFIFDRWQNPEKSLFFDDAEFNLHILSGGSPTKVNLKDRYICLQLPSETNPSHKILCWLRFDYEADFSWVPGGYGFGGDVKANLTLKDAVVGFGVSSLNAGVF